MAHRSLHPSTIEPHHERQRIRARRPPHRFRKSRLRPRKFLWQGVRLPAGPRRLVGFAEEYGQVVVTNAYGDWRSRDLRQFRVASEAAFHRKPFPLPSNREGSMNPVLASGRKAMGVLVTCPGRTGSPTSANHPPFAPADSLAATPPESGPAGFPASRWPVRSAPAALPADHG